MSAILFGLVFICAAIAVALPPLQDEDDVRGAFLTSRPKEKPANSGSANKPTRRRPKNTATTSAKSTETSAKSTNKPAEKSTDTTPVKTTSGTSTKASESRPVNTPRLGLGMTLFGRDSNGLAVRVEPDRVFRNGDRVRILLETNADGYLYIFNRTNDGAPVMIYPDAQIDEGGNYLQAHVPFEIPAPDASDERLRWFAFDENAGTEKVIFVFTREPLKDVPIEDELVTFCGNNKCPWPVGTETWAHVQAQMQEPLKQDRTKTYGSAQTSVEQSASTRGLGLAKDDPQPSLIMMASSTRPTLVATLDLIHK
ncbi:MAG TPA: DUF4384 domain-containing protein [Pyrinomonadaceae bacterium]|nr:DUF4384 domain-containing protein [Pyrinomonadaceae bacterium]